MEAVKLLLGGSPCTHWSITQKQSRETKPTGAGWELFKNYLIAIEKYSPDYFLYENNKSMSADIREQITEELGVEPICINSALVSAQHRQRLYWTNIPGVTQPEDKGAVVADILEPIFPSAEKSYKLQPINTTVDGKSYGIKCNYGKSSAANFMNGGSHYPQTGVIEPIRIGTIENLAKRQDFDSQQYRVYSVYGKSVTLCANGGGVGAKTGLYATPANKELQDREVYAVQGGEISISGIKYPIALPDGLYVIRKLTVRECARLQTVPEWYEFPVSNTQGYKMIGNGWTVDVIAHILSFCPELANAVEVLSMYDGMSCGQLALRKLGVTPTAYFATEIDPYAIKTTMRNFPNTIQLGDAFQVRQNDWRVPALERRVDGRVCDGEHLR